MPIHPHALDANAEQRLTNALDNRLALAVEAVQVAAEQHLAGQIVGPAFVGRGKAFTLEHGNLLGGQAFGRSALAAGQRQHGEQQGPKGETQSLYHGFNSCS
ncbi:hypothetical protein D3C71_1788830 [compost metagenome]